MRWRVVSFVSLGVNLVLALGWGTTTLLSRRSQPAVAPESAPVSSITDRTNVVIRRQLFSWKDIESDDYPTYIANLRDIGCPEQTIRDLIIADVNGLFARRRATELLTPDQQWWKTEPDTNILAAALEKARSLEQERLGMLTRLLGTNWEAGDMVSMPRPTKPGIVLDGPVLGSLTPETKQAVQDINTRSEERLEEYLKARAKEGKGPNPADLARFRQQLRLDLAGVLSPQQLEEYLLRYSQNASELRSEFGQLQYFNPTPDEFRSVFQATDSIDSQLQTLTGNDPNTIQQRKALVQARENAIRVALGPKRYDEYRDLQDPVYRDAVASALQAGTPEAARTIYEVNLAAAAEQAGINADTNLTTDQKTVAAKQLDLEQTVANSLATGQEPYPPMPPMPPPRRTYTVRPGDSLAVIALIYGVPPSAIRQVNPNVNFNQLRPGDTITLPARTMLPLGGP